MHSDSFLHRSRGVSKMGFPLPPAIPIANAINSTILSPLVAGATAAASLANLALVIPQNDPSATKGYQPLNIPTDNDTTNTMQDLPDALLFHYEGENNVSLESDITDHFVEDNTAIEDQIGLRPETVTVTGFIGELNNVLPLPLQILQTINNNLQLVTPYQPSVSQTGQNAINAAFYAYQVASTIASSATSAWNSLAQTEGSAVGNSQISVLTVGAQAVQNKQQLMFQQFYGYWANRNLFNIQTPWAIFTNMAIKSLRTIQDAETRTISSFEVTFKKIRTATTQITSVSLLAAGRAATQSAGLTNLGTTAGVPGASLGTSLLAS